MREESLVLLSLRERGRFGLWFCKKYGLSYLVLLDKLLEGYLKKFYMLLVLLLFF
jgi:hypothetical protein